VPRIRFRHDRTTSRDAAPPNNFSASVFGRSNLRLTARVLMVVPDCPVPADHGGRIDMLGQVQALAALGATVDLLIATYDAPSEAQRALLAPLVRRVIWSPRARGFAAHASLEPFQVASRRSLMRAPLEGPYDLVLLETHYVTAILDHPDVRGTPTALRAQNDEPHYFRGLARAERSPVRTLFYRAEAVRFGWAEPALLTRIDSWLFLSTEELDQFRLDHPTLSSVLLGPPWHPQPRAARSPVPGHVLWLGSLFMVNNRHGLDWYLEQVHPIMLEVEGYHLTIAGNARGTDLTNLRAMAAEPQQRITLLESPAEVDSLYQRASVIAAPIFRGAGVKLKTINAFEHAVPIVTTRVGIEGTRLASPVHLRTAESPDDFAHALRSALIDPATADQRVEAGRKLLGDHNDPESVLRVLLLSVAAQ